MEFKDLKGYPLSYKLQKLRWRSNLTQKEFAEKGGFNYRSVTDWECGKRVPFGRTIEKIRNFYGLPQGFFAENDIETIKMGKNRKKRKSN